MPFSRERFEVTQYLGNILGSKDKYLNSIACMSVDFREIYALIESLEILDVNGLIEPEEYTDQDKKETKAVKEITQKLGQALFTMDIVSHLSMKIGKAYKIYDGE